MNLNGDMEAIITERTMNLIALSVADQPEIFPINYAVQNGTFVFRTAQGTKLAALTINEAVALEIDGYDGDSGWSVAGRLGRTRASARKPAMMIVCILLLTAEQYGWDKVTGVRTKPGIPTSSDKASDCWSDSVCARTKSPWPAHSAPLPRAAVARLELNLLASRGLPLMGRRLPEASGAVNAKAAA